MSTIDMWSLHRARAITMKGTRGKRGADSAAAAVVAMKTQEAATERPTPELSTGGDRLDTNRDERHLQGSIVSVGVRLVTATCFLKDLQHVFIVAVRLSIVVFLSVSNLPFHVHLTECSVAMRSLVMLHLDDMHEPAKTSTPHFPRGGGDQIHMFLSPNDEFWRPV
jgi:hypothetical protein